MEAVKVFLIRNAEGKFLQQNSTPRIGVIFNNIERAWFFPTESQAQSFIASCCKQNNTASIIDCMVIEGEFAPKEGYKAIDEVLKTKRMKSLYDLMKTELSVAELLLFTAASDRVEACKHPFFTKLKAAKLGQGFNSIDVTKSNMGRAWLSDEENDANESFKIFKKLAFVVMKDKAKEQKNE